ncbi:MAG: DGQHR domain-containing protein, partial [Allobaculum sp.]|nr:DGQHR domain-containing protein [Allobaculum sp.]
MKSIKTPVISVSQPIGDFFLGKVRASELKGAVEIRRKSENREGIQRDLINDRLKEIKDYCSDVDATFPTSVILSIDTAKNGVECNIENGYLHLEFIDTFGSVIDGQHRLEGIWRSGKADLFELPVVFTINPT